MKLSLEGLTERILPSASTVVPLPAALPVASGASPSAPPPVADVTPLLVSTMDQWTHLIAALEHDWNSAWNTIAQEIAQEVAYVSQQWDQLLGNIPNASNPPLPLDTQQAAHGPGSGSGSSSHNTPPAVRSGPLAPAFSEYTWKPTDGTILASHWQNWLLGGQPQPGPNGSVPGTQGTDQALFDGKVSNSDIEWDYSKPFSTMILGGQQAYTGLQTIDSNIAIELNGTNGNGSLSMPVTSSKLNLQFNDGSSKFLIDANATITNMTLAGNQLAVFKITGGTTTIAQQAASGKYTETIGVNFVIDTGATLTDYSYNSLQFTNNNLVIGVAGTMKVIYGTGDGTALIDSGVFSKDYIDVNGGTLTYLGSGLIQDTFNAPVLVRGGGAFRLTVSAGASQNGGKLTVKGVVPGQSPNASVYMKDSSSSVQLAFGDTLEADSDYYQAGGTLETTDATKCILQDRADSSGTAIIAGGALIVDTVANTYGELDVNAATLQFGGQLAVSIQGYNPTTEQPQQDVLKVNGGNGAFKLTPQANTSLYVNDYGMLQGGDTWIVLYASNITSDTNTVDFATKTTVPQANLNYSPNRPVQGQYLLSF